MRHAGTTWNKSERCFRRMDEDNDGRVLFDEFVRAVRPIYLYPSFTHYHSYCWKSNYTPVRCSSPVRYHSPARCYSPVHRHYHSPTRRLGSLSPSRRLYGTASKFFEKEVERASLPRTPKRSVRRSSPYRSPYRSPVRYSSVYKSVYRSPARDVLRKIERERELEDRITRSVDRLAYESRVYDRDWYYSRYGTWRRSYNG